MVLKQTRIVRQKVAAPLDDLRVHDMTVQLVKKLIPQRTFCEYLCNKSMHLLVVKCLEYHVHCDFIMT